MSSVQFTDVFFRVYIFVRGSLGRNCVRVWEGCGGTTTQSWSDGFSPSVRRDGSADSLLSAEAAAGNRLLRMQAWESGVSRSVWTLLVN